VNLDVRIPDGAEERAWSVVRGAFAEREPVRRPRPYVKLALVLAAALALVAGVASSAGRAVLGDLREAVGKQNASPALVYLPAPGRLIVPSSDGAWIVQRDGSKRLLERYDEASWSPHGKYVVASRDRELVALEPDGRIRWSLARSARITRARWGGTRADTRIAYLVGRNLRVVGGDGKGDRLLARDVAPAAPAWRPGGGPHLLAFADRRGGIHVLDVDRPARLRRSDPREVPTEVRWSSDGSTIFALAPHSLRILSAARQPVRTIPLPPGPHALTIEPGTTRFALARRSAADRSILLLYDSLETRTPRRLFAATGDFTALEWSPDRKWILMAWPKADQWLFVSTPNAVNVLPVARIAEQFSSRGAFPGLAGWCCAE
jgi:hypothetical protein